MECGSYATVQDTFQGNTSFNISVTFWIRIYLGHHDSQRVMRLLSMVELIIVNLVFLRTEERWQISDSPKPWSS
jgi:hypothetical protein